MGKKEEKDGRLEELKRFYRQQKSMAAKCDYGAKNCATCTDKECKIREYVAV